MKRKKGTNAAAWFYAQPGFHRQEETVSDIQVGKKVAIHGYLCKVLAVGTCSDEGCGKPVVKIIDPEGNEDEVHQDECDGYANAR